MATPLGANGVSMDVRTRRNAASCFESYLYRVISRVAGNGALVIQAQL